MRWFRLLLAFFAAKYRSKLHVTEPSIMPFRVWLTDVDVSIMNHAAMMTVMEAGRIDLMVRCGFLRLARKQKWYFPTSSISVQFLRPLKIFQRAVLTTRILHVSPANIYLEQKITRGEKQMAGCIVRGMVKKGKETLDIPSIIGQLGGVSIPGATPDLVTAFEKQNFMLKEHLNSLEQQGI